MEEVETEKTFKRKELKNTICKFFESWWNDPQDRNYTINECNNPKNTGGKGTDFLNRGQNHSSQQYSCWHKNPGMQNRCWGNPKKMNECEMALTNLQPEVKCEIFKEYYQNQTAHPSEALVTKEEIREILCNTRNNCLSCQNCLE